MGWNAVKAILKILLVTAAALIVSTALALPLFFAIGEVPKNADFASPSVLVITALAFAGTLIAVGAMLWLFDKRNLSDIGLRPVRAVSDTVVGFAFGAAVLLLGMLAAWVIGVAEPKASVTSQEPLPLIVALATALFAAAGEEILLRGYVFFELLSKFGVRAATAVSSVLFALLHSTEMSADAGGVLAFVGVLLAGVLMAIAVIKTGSLWLAIGLHTGWNFTLGPVLGQVVSGQIVDFDRALFALNGPFYMTGGSFGFEASLPALLALLIGIAVLLPLPDRVQSRGAGESPRPQSA